MQKLFKRNFEQKCQELGVGANQSMFFKRGFFQKLGCSPFCAVESDRVSGSSARELQKSFELLCKENTQQLQRSLHVIIHFNISETFVSQSVQSIMENIHKYLKEDTFVVISVQYHENGEKQKESFHLFLEEA